MGDSKSEGKESGEQIIQISQASVSSMRPVPDETGVLLLFFLSSFYYPIKLQYCFSRRRLLGIKEFMSDSSPIAMGLEQDIRLCPREENLLGYSERLDITKEHDMLQIHCACNLKMTVSSVVDSDSDSQVALALTNHRDIGHIRPDLGWVKGAS